MRKPAVMLILAANWAFTAQSVALAQDSPAAADRSVEVRTIQGSRVEVGTIEGSVGALMEGCGVTALSLAVVNDGRVVYTAGFGTLTRGASTPVGSSTVFRAASLSKPVFAYLVLRLVDRGAIDLDTPLFRYLSRPVFTYPEYGELRSDQRFKTITARRVLSHQTGFPNWRWQNKGERLDIKFQPGQGFGYSGEGYEYLQFILEKKLGRSLQQLATENVFVPLGMSQSSFVLEERFEGCLAAELSRAPEFLKTKMRTEASAAGSLVTSAADYGRFLTAVMNGEGLSPKSTREMLSPQVKVMSRRLFGPLAVESGGAPDGLAWCLGWGRFESRLGEGIFHVGQEAGCENYVVAYPVQGVGMVIFAAGGGRQAIAPKLAVRVIGDCYSPFQWAGY